MPVKSIGHAVLKVRSVERAERFYNGILGMPVAVRWDGLGREMTFFTLGNHHELAVAEVGEDAPGPEARGVGLAHLAFCVGDSADDLLAMKQQLDAAGWPIERTIDHGVTWSLYLSDPDGNGIELYVDVSDRWKTDPAELVNTYRPLDPAVLAGG
ncbi:MAG: VOC family protein [Acidimicrobiia bacterium]|nr:VOC family protein [Acidimicrobiia bacterium]